MSTSGALASSVGELVIIDDALCDSAVTHFVRSSIAMVVKPVLSGTVPRHHQRIGANEALTSFHNQ